MNYYFPSKISNKFNFSFRRVAGSKNDPYERDPNICTIPFQQVVHDKLESDVQFALKDKGIDDFPALLELMAMDVISRSKVLDMHPSKVTNTLFSDPLADIVYVGIEIKGQPPGVSSFLYDMSKQGRIDEIPGVLQSRFETIHDFSTFLTGFLFVGISVNPDVFPNIGAQVTTMVLYISFYLSMFSACTALMAKDMMLTYTGASDQEIVKGLEKQPYLYELCSVPIKLAVLASFYVTCAEASTIYIFPLRVTCWGATVSVLIGTYFVKCWCLRLEDRTVSCIDL